MQTTFKLPIDFIFYKYKLQIRFLSFSTFSLELAATESVVFNKTLSWTKPQLGQNRLFPKNLCNLLSVC